MDTGYLVKHRNAVSPDGMFIEFPIKKGTNITNLTNNQLVNFKLVTEYVEPDDSIHCNRGVEIQVAVIMTDDDIWNDVKASIYTGSKDTDEAIDWVLDTLREKGYKIDK